MATRQISRRQVTTGELAHPLLGYEEARARVLEGFAPLPPVDVPLARALGRVTAEPVVAAMDVPGFDNSAMDGYAIRAADVVGASRNQPCVLGLADPPHGPGPARPLPAGCATKVMTGGPIPAGADAVVPWEQTEERHEGVAVLGEVAPGRFVRPRGEDMRSGTTVVPEGQLLGPVHIGVLAALGGDGVRVRARPRVAVLSTGDELVPPGERAGEGQRHDANGSLLAARAEVSGATVAVTGLLPDDPDAIAAWLEAVAPDVDLVLTSGGASVGERDWAREVLRREGQLVLWRVAIKPGKPIAFGHVGGTPVFALPGNPGSAFVCAHAFVAPAIRVMAGRDPTPPIVPARLVHDVGGSPERTLFCPIRLEGTDALPLPEQSSNVLSNLLPADGFAVVPPGGLASGAEVWVELLS